MITSHFSKLTLCAFLIANSFGQVAVAHKEVTVKQCAQPILKAHKIAAALLAVACLAAVAAEPTKGSHEVSVEVFEKSVIDWLRNIWGWLPKDPKVKSVNEETGLPVYKAGREGRGIVGAAAQVSKTLAPVTALMLLVKALEPWCQMANIFDETVSPKLA